MAWNRSVIVVLALSMVAGLSLGGLLLAQQQPPPMTGLDREHVQGMLRDAYENVKKNYYDPKFHGVDLEARYHAYIEKIKAAKTLNQGMTVVAGYLDTLKDSHTTFIPPARPYRFDYGYRIQIIGEKAFITRVRPETDAAAKVNPGDEVVTLNGYDVNRDDLDSLHYYLNGLSPQPATKLVVRSPDGTERTVVVATKTKAGKQLVNLVDEENTDLWQMVLEEENEDHVSRHAYYEMGDVVIWRMPQFDLDNLMVDNLFSVARKHKTLILDMRSNPGGYVKTLERMVGNLFDHDVKIADRTGRKEEKPPLGKSRGGNTFTGKLIVLIDSDSASAAELLARVVQLEQRGTVIGDRSSGSVMDAKRYSCSQGTDTKIFYSFSVTDADLIMKDGKSLEHTGVTPDEIVIPTAADIAAGRDPVLSRAAKLAGIELDPVKAGKLFPFEWVSF